MRRKEAKEEARRKQAEKEARAKMSPAEWFQTLKVGDELAMCPVTPCVSMVVVGRMLQAGGPLRDEAPLVDV